MDNREKILDEFFRKNDPQKSKKVEKEKKSKKIDEYFESVSTQKSPKKKSFLDKIVDFFRITSFKNRFDENKVAANAQKIEVEGKNRFVKFLTRIKNFFVNQFSFEAGVDILDETSVLYRKNRVIKNIIWYTNIIFLLFTLIGSEGVNRSVNIIVTVVIFLIMFSTSQSVKKIISEEPKTLQKQQMAEYISGVYILMMAITVYVKIRLTLGDTLEGGFFSITMAAYSLIYFSLVVIALYQDTRLTSNLQSNHHRNDNHSYIDFVSFI